MIISLKTFYIKKNVVIWKFKSLNIMNLVGIINNENVKANQEQNKNKNKMVENKIIKYSKIIYIFI